MSNVKNGGKRPSCKRILKNALVTVGILAAAAALSLVVERLLEIREYSAAIFVFAVFLISLWTDGYAWGMVSVVASVAMVNYAFTAPYFSFDFAVPGSFISAVIMIVISFLTCTLTTKIKNHESEKAESEKERMRANLLRAVSHDLRTPLTTIYGSASTLLENGDGIEPKKREQMLRGIMEDSEWLVRMVENLLSITKIDSGKVKIIKTPTVLEELIDSVLIKFKKRYPEREVAVDIPDAITIIPMDAMLIEQVIVNLLENAEQHAYGMKHLSIKVRVASGEARFEIEDDGCGFKPELIAKLFSGYYSVSDEGSDGHKHNAGIGLSVCQTIIKAHGGSICAENRKEGGALVRFTLPVSPMEENFDGQLYQQ
ncbi:MAG TPA: PAS domain-containing sensor histidine kinase [Candidatus Faeciplasma gallinarum]|uniref:histidine kinase n=1 Tax=Candidatus Faeciplasma gallinarum TaxID=2840799 RepID=A0A9D1EMW7_9FIRM|nr:PAS domain-containing sensor histidine kinase [Candidatus Faeciplasma gallinarum]